jgi:hypothetical protein
MNWRQRIVAIVLLAVWMPASSLCLAECAKLVKRGDCCAHDSGGKADAAGGACCLLALGGYKSDTQRSWVPVPILLAIALAPSLLHRLSAAARLSLPSPNASPPVLPVTWQFSFRAALPPRAPSSAS